jgi:LysR family hydrogen peroxide-inducible transcriptional activator
VGLIPTVSPYLLPDVAPALASDLPRLSLVWSEDKTAALTAALAAGQLDAAVLALGPELGDVEQAVIGDDRFVLALGAAHPLAASARPIAAADLDAVELMLLSEGHCLRDQAIAACGRRRGRHSSFGATSLGTLTQMVAAGGGATLLPELALATENRRGRLHVRRFARPAPGRTLVLVWRRGSAVETAARRIAEIMRASYARMSRGKSNG